MNCTFTSSQVGVVNSIIVNRWCFSVLTFSTYLTKSMLDLEFELKLASGNIGSNFDTEQVGQSSAKWLTRVAQCMK